MKIEQVIGTALTTKKGDKMKKLVKTLLVCGSASALVATTALAQPYVVNLDENGNLLVVNAKNNSTVFSGQALSSINTDPISGQSGLYYDFGPLLDSLQKGLASTAGDIALTEAGAAGPSDIFRIMGNGSPGGSGLRGMFVFSLADDADSTDVADTDAGTFAAVAATLGQNGQILPGTEAAEGLKNGLFGYQPTTAGQPGLIAIAPGAVIYNLTSDQMVPEPSTLALFGVAGGLLALFWRQRRA